MMRKAEMQVLVGMASDSVLKKGGRIYPSSSFTNEGMAECGVVDRCKDKLRAGVHRALPVELSRRAQMRVTAR